MRFTAFFIVLLSLPATAQTDVETSVLPRIIDTLCLDLVEARNGCETVVLLTSETDPDAADLILFSDRRATNPQEVLAVVRNIAYSGPWFGQAPYFEQSDSGALLLQSEQTGIGRTPWTQTLTIVHRDDGFVVAGQTYSTYDRAVGGSFSCDVNLLTGDWTSSAERVNPEAEETTYDVSDNGRIAGERPSLTEWNYARSLPAPCEAALTAWFDASP